MYIYTHKEKRISRVYVSRRIKRILDFFWNSKKCAEATENNTDYIHTQQCEVCFCFLCSRMASYTYKYIHPKQEKVSYIKTINQSI